VNPQQVGEVRHASGDAASTSMWRLMKTSMFSETPKHAAPPQPAATSIIFLTGGGRARAEQEQSQKQEKAWISG